ncbi:gamma-butyrobetaine hydroxylase-like domain-containing protein [Thauera sp. WH-2]|jgi:DUF971 family protein|uniref:gamma-butyrobetaine hydroxylase-like domain-containing protein n=1 Tax=Thauera sp. WH-2 TaxID=3401574 RepID=UPI003AAC94EF
MAGLDETTPIPTEITLHSLSKLLEIAFDDGSRFTLPFEFLRVYSPSAEVRGHGPGQETLQQGKRDVDIVDIHPVGNYAIKPVFSDGHDSGLYSWDYLYSIASHQEELWSAYLEALERNGGTRDPAKVPPPPARAKGGCGHQH